MRIVAGIATGTMVALLTGCISLKIGTDTQPPSLRMSGLVNGYASAAALHPYNGTILNFGLFSKAERRGEFLSLDVWPLAGVGVGVVGARVRVLPLELGLGVLWYDPKPEAIPPEKSKVEKAPSAPKETPKEEKAPNAPDATPPEGGGSNPAPAPGPTSI
jgi:hypothetical protein